jgi:flagellar hook protein FlgE
VILNLPANATPPTVAPFDPTNSLTYNQSTSTTVYDSLGNCLSGDHVLHADRGAQCLERQHDGQRHDGRAAQDLTFNTPVRSPPANGG